MKSLMEDRMRDANLDERKLTYLWARGRWSLVIASLFKLELRNALEKHATRRNLMIAAAGCLGALFLLDSLPTGTENLADSTVTFIRSLVVKAFFALPILWLFGWIQRERMGWVASEYGKDSEALQDAARSDVRRGHEHIYQSDWVLAPPAPVKKQDPKAAPRFGAK